MTRTTIPGDAPPLNQDDPTIQAIKSLFNEIHSLKENMASSMASMRKEMASKEDLASMRKEMEDRLKKTENALKLDMFEMRGDLLGQIDQIKRDTRRQFKEMDRKMQYISGAMSFNQVAGQAPQPGFIERSPAPTGVGLQEGIEDYEYPNPYF